MRLCRSSLLLKHQCSGCTCPMSSRNPLFKTLKPVPNPTPNPLVPTSKPIVGKHMHLPVCRRIHRASRALVGLASFSSMRGLFAIHALPLQLLGASINYVDAHFPSRCLYGKTSPYRGLCSLVYLLLAVSSELLRFPGPADSWSLLAWSG